MNIQCFCLAESAGKEKLFKFIQNYIRDTRGVFSISLLAMITIFRFLWIFYACLSKQSACLYNKKRKLLTRWLEDMNFTFSCYKQYASCSLRLLGKKYCFYHSQTKPYLRAPCHLFYLFAITYYSKLRYESKKDLFTSSLSDRWILPGLYQVPERAVWAFDLKFEGLEFKSRSDR